LGQENARIKVAKGSAENGVCVRMDTSSDKITQHGV
jgi:hypothetical protein